MTDRAQFEAMLEALINDDQQAAKEIFHNIVVGKSREIYESLLEDDFGGEEPAMEEEEEESSAPKAKDQGNPYGSDDEESEDDAEDDAEDDGEEEPEDDGEGEEDPFGGEEDGEGEDGGDIEDRVMDLEDALEDLKAEFEQLMSDEAHEPEHHDGMDDPSFGGAMGGDEMGGDLETELMEYVNKVPSPSHGDNGTNTKSLIDNMKNDMGGTTANIAQSFSTTSGGTQGGLLKPSTAKLDGGNVNVPGNKKAPAYKNDGKGHGAEKKGAKPGANVGADSGDSETTGEKNTQSTLRPLKK